VNKGVWALASLAVLSGASVVGVVATSSGGEEEAVQQATTTASQVSSERGQIDCGFGTPVELDGRSASSFTFKAEDAPARLQAFAVQVEPMPLSLYGDIILHATCAPEGGCLNMDSGELVTEARMSQIDWRIIGAGEITITVHESVETESLPAKEYHFASFAYDHSADRVCTAERLYCYTVRVNYSRLK